MSQVWGKDGFEGMTMYQELIERLRQDYNEERKYQWMRLDCEEAAYTIERMQAELELAKRERDVVPVAHGRWIHDHQKGLVCSVCEKAIWVWTKGLKTPYCPNCGTKMDLE